MEQSRNSVAAEMSHKSSPLNTSSSTLLNNFVFKQGVMIKQGAKVKNYKKRYFFLYGHKLTYHKMNKKKEPSKAAQGEIILPRFSSLKQQKLESIVYEMTQIDPKASKEGLQFGFIVSDLEGNRGDYFLFTASRQESLDWIEAIRNAIQMNASSSPGKMQRMSSYDSDTFDGVTSILSKQSSMSSINSEENLDSPAAVSNSPATPRGFFSRFTLKLNNPVVNSHDQNLLDNNTPSPRSSASRESKQFVSHLKSYNSYDSPQMQSSIMSTSISPSNSGGVLKAGSFQDTATSSSSSSSLGFADFLQQVDENQIELPNNVETDADVMSERRNSIPYSPNNETSTSTGPQSTGATLTDEEEFNIALCAASIFLKDELERPPCEQAYVIAMKHFRNQLVEHAKRCGGRPSYGLAVGTVIFCIDEEERTPMEREFIGDVLDQYKDHLQWMNTDAWKPYFLDPLENENELTKTKRGHLNEMSSVFLSQASLENIPLTIQAAIVKSSKEILKKPCEDRTEEEREFVNRLKQLHGYFEKLFFKHGLIPNRASLIATSLFDLEDYLFEEEEFDESYLTDANLKERDMNRLDLFSHNLDSLLYDFKKSIV